MTSAAALVLVLAACGPKPAPARAPIANRPAPAAAPAPVAARSDAEPPTGPAFDRTMARFIALIDAMAQAAVDAGSDCAKGTANLERVLDDNLALIRDAKRWNQDPGYKAASEAWVKEHMDEFMQPMMKVAALGQTCANDPAFAAMMARFTDLD
ncbi:MAG: hypothetical protein R3B06_26535 [Kofleriaceae bacterium]